MQLCIFRIFVHPSSLPEEIIHVSFLLFLFLGILDAIGSGASGNNFDSFRREGALVLIELLRDVQRE